MEPIVPLNYLKKIIDTEYKKKQEGKENYVDYMKRMFKYTLPIFGIIAAYNWLKR